jgi:hypothetical protein
VYLSSLLVIGLYFKFNRFWSVRNLDLLLLILLAPGLLMAQYGGEASVKARRAEILEMKAAEVAAKATDTEPVAAASSAGGALPEPPTLSKPPTLANMKPANEPVNDLPPAAASPVEDLEQTAIAAAKETLQRCQEIERLGYLWLFAVGGVLLVRLLLDPTMVRRPLLEPNLTAGGLTFIGCSLFVFLMANVITSHAPKLDRLNEQTSAQIAAAEAKVETAHPAPHGPGYALLELIPNIPTNPLVPEGVDLNEYGRAYIITAKLVAILCHLAVVLGIIAVGYWHFGNMKTGVGMASLYLMLPYTAQMTGRIDHVIPAALLVWAILGYRRPLTAGMFLGLATSLVYYPLFLLPLWVSFYSRRGLMRFGAGVVGMLLLMAISLVFIPDTSYWQNLKQMFGLWLPVQQGLEGIWGLGWNAMYRLPVLAAFVALSGTLAVWPAQKNLGTLLSCSAAVMVATQFWHGYGGGLYMAWYLPLTLLAVFRPNLEDRVALAVVGEGWGVRRAANLANGFKAA